MSIATRTRRLLYLIHRWMGVAACVLMALWFVSGIVMLFVGYPKFTPWERLGALPALQANSIRVPLTRVLDAIDVPVSEVVLTSIGGRPCYRLQLRDDRLIAVDAANGTRLSVDTAHLLASARSFLPQVTAQDRGAVQEDRWTHSRALDPHRPLHVIDMHDPDRTRLYLSSATGEVVLDAPRAQRGWNYVGAWLHWLYYFRDRPIDPVWSWIVIVLSAAGTLVAISGTVVGIWRWRFSGHYKSGGHSPYRESWLRWHHILGLAFAAIIFTWIFSGLMSMNPVGIFDARGQKPDLAAWRNGDPVVDRLPLQAGAAVSLLEQHGFRAVEIYWRVLDGQSYLLARNAKADTRLIVLGEDGSPAVRTQWDRSTLLHAATRLMASTIASQQELARYDNYYYARQPEAMMGAAERRLPVLRVRFTDAHATWSYIDPFTGEVALSVDRAQRAGRWLFNFLHSWDVPVMLTSGIGRDVILILLSLGGLAMSITGVVIGYARLRIWSNKQGKKRPIATRA